MDKVMKTTKERSQKFETMPSRKRGEGSVFPKKGSRFLYIQYYGLNGKPIQESSKSASQTVALKLLQKRQGEVANGIVTVDVRKTSYEDIRALLIADYKAKKNKSLLTRSDGTQTICGLDHLDGYFSGWQAMRITTDVLRDYNTKKQAENLDAPTVNRHFALLRRMMRLAWRESKLREPPYFPMNRENGPRKGFVTDEQFQKIRSHLPRILWPLVTFLYFTGVRLGEALLIVWPQVNLDRKEIRLEGEQTKSRSPRIAPLTDELVGMLKKQFRTDGLAFYSTNLRKAWKNATQLAGCPGILIHDLRRSAVRNLMDDGTQTAVAMSISGHKTEAIFQRYNITTAQQAHEAMERRERSQKGSA
jgi:integrase